MSKICAAGGRGLRTTCDPTWRPAIVYIATMMAVLFVYSAVGGGMEAQWMGVGLLWFGEAFRRRSVGLHKEDGWMHQPQKGQTPHTHKAAVRLCDVPARYPRVSSEVSGAELTFCFSGTLPFVSSRFRQDPSTSRASAPTLICLQRAIGHKPYTQTDTTWPKTTRRHKRSTACSTSAPTLDPISQHRRRESPSQKAYNRLWTRTRRCGRFCPTVERKIRPTQTCDMRRMRVA